MVEIDLTGGNVNVIGNRGDEHLFRLSNPIDQDVINSAGEYDAEFISHLGEHFPVVLVLNEIESGILVVPITINAGIYLIRRLNPRRTLLTVKVDSR